MPELNVSLLEEVMGTIKMSPELLDMSSWCGTACCLAGWTVRVAEEQGLARVRRGFDVHLKGRPIGELLHPSGAAQELLGLTDEEAEELFVIGYGSNLFGVTVDELERKVKQFIEDKQRG